MTDYPIPDDLAAKLTSATDDPGRFVNRGETLGVPSEPLCEWQARAVFAALAEWADGAVIDPNGWRRLVVREVGGDPTNPAALYTITERTGR